jgi:flagellar biosynthesis protein
MTIDQESPMIDLHDNAPQEPSSQKRTRTKAVALEYDRTQDDAPRIVASGAGVVAEQILSLAFAHGVRVREDADLVEILSQLEVDSVIPIETFAAVAEILNYVYRANARYGKPQPS